MPLPLFNCSGVEDEVCCEALWRIGEHILDIAFTALEGCTTPGTCKGPGLTKYIAFSDASTWCCDTVAVFMDGTSATTGSAASLQTGLQTSRIGLTTQWRVQLRESCYPTLDNEGTPTPKEYHFVNRHLYAHGEMMLRALQQAHEHKNLHPAGCAASAIRFFRPLPVQAYCVGWEAQVEVLSDWRQWWA